LEIVWSAGREYIIPSDANNKIEIAVDLPDAGISSDLTGGTEKLICLFGIEKTPARVITPATVASWPITNNLITCEVPYEYDINKCPVYIVIDTIRSASSDGLMLAGANAGKMAIKFSVTETVGGTGKLVEEVNYTLVQDAR